MARIYVGPHVENIVFTSDVAQSQRRFVHPVLLIRKVTSIV